MLCLDGTQCAESDLMILGMFVWIVFSCITLEQPV